MEICKDSNIVEVLNGAPQFKDILFRRAFVITSEILTTTDDYPFYGNWAEVKLGEKFYLYVHKDIKAHIFSHNDITYFLIGHAYDPFNLLIDENEILAHLSSVMQKNDAMFWDEESNLTGVFCIGFVKDDEIFYSTDATGMQVLYQGVVNGAFYLTSHSKLIGDLKNLTRTEYINKLVSSKFWKYWGMYLPGDISPYNELKRVIPNFCNTYSCDKQKISWRRFFPLKKIEEVSTEKAYQEIIRELGNIMSNTMKCISQKWPNKKVSISVTGGRDSMTTLACSQGLYDKFHYFSYISNYDEFVDAEAAGEILRHLGLEHEVFKIPDESWIGYKDINAFKDIMECNASCIGENNPNDLRKRRYFLEYPPCDVEVKSWVNEAGRGWEYNKYNKKRFPKYPYASYWRAMHKVYLSPYLIHETDRIFEEYLARYYSRDIFDRLSWLELYFWEFTCSASEAYFLTTEHRVSYEITIPYNNRKYLALMMTVPIEKRKRDAIPNDLITYMEPRITETDVVVKDVSHTNFRSFIVRLYLELFSKIKF